jgi:hypothetical protein
MAKQPSKTARADSSAGAGAAGVSSNTDAVAAAEPKPVAVAEPAAAVDHAVADDTVLDRAALLAVIKDMAEDLPGMIAELETQARLSAQSADHSEHAMYARLATVFGEFRTGLESVLNAPQV